MSTSRSEYVIKNVSISILMQIVKNILSFISRTLFIRVLGAEYLGVNSLFTQILTVLSFAELGIGNAMVYSLYKPLGERDQEKLKSLMRLYEKAYRIVAIIIAVLGVAVIPFLKYFVRDVSYVKENVTLLYCLFLLNTIISYFFVYKKSMIIADQKNYIVEIYAQLFYAIQVVVQSVLLIVTRQFIPYLIVVIVFTILNNVWVARKADKMYPYLRDKNVRLLEKIEISSIVTNVKALVVYKVGGIALESTDSIFISSIINILTVGLYSNYKMIIDIFRSVGSQVMNSIIASVGSLNAEEDSSKKEAVFYDMFYLSAWFYGFTAVGLCLFLSPLIKVWIGDKYILGFSAVVATCVYYYVTNMHYPCYTFRTTAGLFVYGKYVPIAATVINIVLGTLFGINFGLQGIIWASTITRLLTYEIIDSWLIYKHVFNRSVWKYFTKYGGYAILCVVDGLVCNKAVMVIHFYGFWGLAYKAIIMTVIYNLIFLLVTQYTKEFKSLVTRIKQVIKSKSKWNKVSA
jgi:O-antigen/teichoic acid export membrane protein